MTELTKAELIVMRCIWEMGDGVTKQEIEKNIEARFHKGWRPRECYYTCLIQEKEYQDAQMKEMFEFWGKRNAGAMLASFFKEQGLEPEAAEKVKELIDELDF